MISAAPIILFIGATLALWLGALIHRRATAPGAPAFVWLMAAIALWCVTSAFHGLTPALSEKLLWAKVQYLAIATVPPLWFAFLCEYVGATWAADRRIRIALALMAIITVGLAMSNESHGLIWSVVETTSAGVVVYHHGPWFWFTVAYSYALVLGGTFVLLRAIRRSPSAYRGQLSTLIIASLIPCAFARWGTSPPNCSSTSAPVTPASAPSPRAASRPS